tara:strand:+ start:206 stop:373 length:168 start_codon:yes stop_codon:yes gene_type:complete
MQHSSNFAISLCLLQNRNDLCGKGEECGSSLESWPTMIECIVLEKHDLGKRLAFT